MAEAPADDAHDDSDGDEILDLGTADFVEQADDDFGEADSDDGSEDSDSPLTTETATDTMRENLAALAMLSEPSVPPQIVRTGETSLEGLVREMLRPMLADWLDTNLPEMVEKMVKDAEANADSDKKKRESVEAKNQAESLIHSTEKSLEEHGDKVSAEDKEAIENAMGELKTALEGDDGDEINTKAQALAEASMKMGQAIYEAQQSEEEARGYDRRRDLRTH